MRKIIPDGIILREVVPIGTKKELICVNPNRDYVKPSRVIRMIVRGQFMSSVKVRCHENNYARMESSEAWRLVEKNISKGGFF